MKLTDLSPEQKRIAIAEACGWRDCCVATTEKYWKDGDVIGQPKEEYGWCILPDYLNDLNAMHEAEKVLTRKQVSHYGELLSESANRTYDYPASYLVATATAAQRAEAFLRTLNLWKQ